MDKIVNKKELVVRKRIASFIEKILRFCGYDFRHDLYKQIVYGEVSICTPLEETIKDLYDAYYYLLSNHKRPLDKVLLKKFFYLLNGKEPDEALLIRIVSKFFYLDALPPIEKAIEFHLYVYKELGESNNINGLIIPLMLFNYSLVKSGIPSLRFITPTLKKYIQYRQKYIDGDKSPLYGLILEQLREAKFQDKSYYGNLRVLSTQEIFNRIIKDKNMLQERFGIQHIYLFGSFAKDLQRIDSDIDLLVVFSQNLSYETKTKFIEELANYYFNIFNRFMDFGEISDFISDEIIKEITTYIKIY